jgi:NAD(P)H-dependent flavin oxidoreductase YrpB (nitropropane dioxygenase family)
MKSLKIGDLIAKLPIIQGGMGVGISLSGLASAVANEGGIGTETRFTIVQHNLSNINKFGDGNQFTAEKALSARDSYFFTLNGVV